MHNHDHAHLPAPAPGENPAALNRKLSWSIALNALILPKGALDEDSRTLIYLAASLAAGSHACIQAMANKAKMQNIPAAKVLETVHIVRFALATKVIGEAEPVFAALAKA